MKRFILLLLLLGSVWKGYAQEGRKTLGYLMAPYISTDGLFTSNRQGNADNSFSNGIFYNQDINNNFGFSAAMEFRYQTRASFCNTCSDTARWRPIAAENHLFYLEAPVNMAYNLNLKDDARFRSYLLLGYTYSRLIYFYQTVSQQGQTLRIDKEDLQNFGTRQTSHIINLGLDFRYFINDDYMIGISPMARLPVFYINDPGYLAIRLLIGRNLN